MAGVGALIWDGVCIFHGGNALPGAGGLGDRLGIDPEDRGNSAERDTQPIRALSGLIGQFIEGLVENEPVQQELLGFAELPVSTQEGCDRGLLPGCDLLGLALFDVARIGAVMGVGEAVEGHARRVAKASDHSGDVANGQVGLGPL